MEISLVVGLLVMGLSHLIAVVVGVCLGHLVTSGKLVQPVRRVAINPYKGIQNPMVAQDLVDAIPEIAPVETPYGMSGNLTEEEIKYARRAMEAGTGEGFQI